MESLIVAAGRCLGRLELVANIATSRALAHSPAADGRALRSLGKPESEICKVTCPLVVLIVVAVSARHL